MGGKRWELIRESIHELTEGELGYPGTKLSLEAWVPQLEDKISCVIFLDEEQARTIPYSEIRDKMVWSIERDIEEAISNM